MKTPIRQWLSSAILSVGLAGALQAQVNTATVSGTVQDPTGAVVLGAKIELHSVATGLDRLATSADQGFYIFDYVPVGTYTITCTSPGFASTQSQIVLVAAQEMKLDFALKSQTANQQVVVTGEAPLMDTVSSQDHNTLGSQQIVTLPLSHDNWTNLLTQNTGSIKQTSSGSSSQNLGLSLNGLPTAGFNLTVDGTNAANDPEMAIFGFYQSPNIIDTLAHDAIQEVSVVKGIVPATFGGAMSGGVNLITRSGTNQFHGTLWEINQISALDARNYFATTRPRLTYNQYGGAVGGPIFKNKLFFFGAYEGARLSQFEVISGSVPTPFIRAISPAIYTPELNDLPTVPEPASDPAACSQPNPSPALACSTNATYQGTAAQRQNDGSTVVRIDETLNSHNAWYARVTRNRPYIDTPALNVANPQITSTTGDVYNIGFLHQFQNLSSNSRFGYNRLRLNRDQIGFASNVEGISFGFGTGSAEDFTKAGRIVSGDQGFAITRGKHSLQFGGIVQRNDAGRTDRNTASFTYSNLTQYLNNTPSKATVNFDVTAFNDYMWQFGGFIQDDYRLTPTLTLNVGFRYDHYTVVKESSGRVFNRGRDPVLGDGFGPFQPVNEMYNADYHTGFQPRLGFAWSPEHLRTVVRGGFGILTGPRPIYAGPIGVSPTSATAPANLNLTQTQITTADNDGVPIAFPTPNSTLPTLLAGLQKAGIVGTTFADSSVDVVNNNPYSIQWTLAIEKAFPARMVLDLGYAGNHGLNETFTFVANEPSRTTGISPNPLWGTFNRFMPGDKSNYNALEAKLIKQVQFGLSFGANFTWAKSLSFGDANLLQETSPQDLANLRSEYGPTQYDIRDNFSSNVIWEIPLQEWFKSSNSALTMLERGWRATFVVNANTGLPINVINGASAFSGDRPNILAARPYLTNYHSAFASGQGTHQYLLPSSQISNPLALPVGFAPPTGLCNGVSAVYCGGVQTLDGDLNRDALRNIGQYTIDFNAAKALVFSESLRVDFHVDAFNVLNHANFAGLGLSTNSSTFGYFTSATPRTIQLGGRFTF